METHRNPEDTPASIPGQRHGDRSIRGGNLFHDVMLLRAADCISDLTGQAKYRDAATAYLKFYFEHCRQPTGLFPWGEHAYWDFFAERRATPGTSTWAARRRRSGSAAGNSVPRRFAARPTDC